GAPRPTKLEMAETLITVAWLFMLPTDWLNATIPVFRFTELLIVSAFTVLMSNDRLPSLTWFRPASDSAVKVLSPTAAARALCWEFMFPAFWLPIITPMSSLNELIRSAVMYGVSDRSEPIGLGGLIVPFSPVTGVPAPSTS